MEWVSNLESVNCISVSLLSDLFDFGWKESVLIHAIVVLDSLAESHALSGDEEVTLLFHSLNFWM